MVLFDNRDLHSHYKVGQPRMEHVDWTANVDFEKHVLSCVAVITFDRDGEVDLDTRDLSISGITTERGKPLEFKLGARDPILGSCLTVTVPVLPPRIVVHWQTAPAASGLQWLAPEQTGSKKHPLLFSQCEPIHARSCMPCQDTPGVKFTFKVRLIVPSALRGLMGANRHLGRTKIGQLLAVEEWAMDHPIPAYLLALTVGDLVSRDISNRHSVWTERSMATAAAREFSDLPKMMQQAEKLFGPYLWGRYSVQVMPFSFPYGGMENPCLSFLTPALIAGDKSGLSTVAHELAHSWTGNLITNATWPDFWLNEGWTVYAEWRIIEAIYGRNVAELGKALFARDFERDVKRLVATRPLLTALRPDLTGMSPDDAFSSVPYFKGAMFLVLLERTVGREKFDVFIRKYIERFRFSSITTAQFLDFARDELPVGTLERVLAWEWVYEAGLPANAPAIASPLIDDVKRWAEVGKVPPLDAGKKWSAQQWVLYLELLPRPAAVEEIIVELNKDYHLGDARNADVRSAYLLLAVESGYEAVNEKVRAFLLKHGRMKYLKPLYRALCATESGRAFAQQILDKARPGYHPIATTQVERIFREANT